jgi:hypothetical protein
MSWKKFAEAKIGVAGQVECENHVDGFSYIQGLVHHEFLCQGQTVNSWYYLKMPTQTYLCFLSHPILLTWLRQTFSYYPN